MNDRQPNIRIQWRDKTILVYLDDQLTDRALEIADALANAADAAETKDQLRRGVTQVALSNELELMTFAADGGHVDPLEMLVTVGLRPAPSPQNPTVVGR